MADTSTLSPENQAASNTLNKMLAEAGVDAQLDVAVTVASTYDQSPQPESKESLTITVSSPQAATQPLAIAEEINKVLGTIPALDKRVQFETDGEHAVQMREKLEKLIEAGAEVPKEYLEWGGFKPGVEEKVSWRNPLKKHALDIINNDLQTDIFINVPLGKDDKNDSKKAVDAIEQNIKNRLEDIKTTLTERISKYENATTDEAKSAIKESVDALQFKINTTDISEEQGNNARVRILIQSPEQIKADSTPGTVASLNDEQQEALAHTNPLNRLSSNQRNKALARAILYAGESAQEVFPKIAGREDMKRALSTSLEKLKKEKPELAETVDSYLGDDTFKNNETWMRSPSERPELESRPIVKTGDDGKLEINLAMPKGAAGEVIQELAAQAPQQEQSASSMANPQTSMGAALPPSEQDKAMQDAINAILRRHQEAALTR